MAYQNTLVLKTNASLGTSILIDDLGFPLDASGANPVTLDEYNELMEAAGSEDLRALLVDNSQGVGSSTVIANDGTSDLSNDDAIAYLDTILAVSHSEQLHANYSAVKTDANGEITNDLTTNAGSPSNLNNWALGTNLDAAGNIITGLGAGVNPTDSVNKAQLDSIAASSKVWKELVLDCSSQLLDGASGGIRSTTAFFLQENPTANDTISIAHTTLTNETFTFKASEAAAFDVGIGASVDDTLANLAQAINDDSSGWGATLVTSLQSINNGTGSVTAGLVVIIYELAATDAGDSRIYGGFTTGVPLYVNYNGEANYEKTTTSALPVADPAQREFGIGRATVNLVVNETHACRTDDSIKTWDNDGLAWQNTGANGIQAGAGLIKVGDTLSVDFGELVDIADVGTSSSAGILDEAARADHVHAHGDLSGVAQTHHDTVQIDEDQVLPRIGAGTAPTTQAVVNAAINSNFGNGQYVGKVIHYVETQRIPNSGTRYLQIGPLVTSKVGKRMLRNGIISGLALQVNVVDASRDFKLSVEVSTNNGSTWAEAALLALSASSIGAHSIAPTAGVAGLSYNAGDLLRVSVVRTSGSGRSTFRNMDATIEYHEG